MKSVAEIAVDEVTLSHVSDCPKEALLLRASGRNDPKLRLASPSHTANVPELLLRCIEYDLFA
jgi:hypothetical protein